VTYFPPQALTAPASIISYRDSASRKLGRVALAKLDLPQRPALPVDVPDDDDRADTAA
jgi:hypothetical protein